jgi:hypothetical protein
MSEANKILGNYSKQELKIGIFRTFFLLLIGIGLYAIFQTHPLMTFGFDMWYHLDRIDQIMSGGIAERKRYTWYVPWAIILKYFAIGDVLIRANIIHYTQMLISVMCVYVSSNIFLKCLFKAKLSRVDNIKLKFIAVLSTILWTTLNATESQGLHHVWLFWYSINYQITLPLYILATALTLQIVDHSNSKQQKKYSLVLIGCIVIYILLTHEMEFLYYFIAFLSIIVCYADMIYKRTSIKYIIWVVLILFIVAFFYKYFYFGEVPALIKYIDRGFYSTINEKIIQYGNENINGLNRASASVNEMLILSEILLIPIYLLSVIKESFVNLRVS